MLSIFSSDRRIGRPTIEGKIDSGKLAPAKPHFTNFKKKHLIFIFFFQKITPVPLSQTTTLFEGILMISLFFFK